MIEAKNIYSGYGKAEILQGVDLTAEKGKITTIVGNNGSGKSTLLKTLLGFAALTKGEIIIEGISIQELSSSELAKRIAYLPQGKNIPDISAGRLVLHGRFPYLQYPRRYGKEDFAIAEAAMKQMGVWELSEKPLITLSGGMRQKVYIAMTLAQQAPIILMDEPTAYLDIGQQIRFAEMIQELSQKGKTVILVLHDLLLALKISHRIVVMDRGKVIMAGTPEEILRSSVPEEVFGVAVKTVQTEKGVQYYYESGGKR